MSLLMTVPLLAHHSVKAEHDTTKIITIRGTVTKIDFINPHARFYLDAVEPDGKVTSWAFEMIAPNALIMRGLSKGFLKEGDQVSVDAYPSKDGGKFASARMLTWPDGRTLDVHDSFGGQQ